MRSRWSFSGAWCRGNFADAAAVVPGCRETFAAAAHAGSLPAGGLRAGDSVTLTLYYQAAQATAVDLTRFVHVYDPALGLAAQADSQPQSGRNPTSAWQPGEQVVEHVVLTISPAAKPGRYQLLLGFYDPANGSRLAVLDAANQSLPDGRLPITTVTLE